MLLIENVRSLFHRRKVEDGLSSQQACKPLFDNNMFYKSDDVH